MFQSGDIAISCSGCAFVFGFLVWLYLGWVKHNKLCNAQVIAFFQLRFYICFVCVKHGDIIVYLFLILWDIRKFEVSLQQKWGNLFFKTPHSMLQTSQPLGTKNQEVELSSKTWRFLKKHGDSRLTIKMWDFVENYDTL